MKIIRCTGCNIIVAKITEGSLLKKKSVMLCENCETKRKASDLAAKNKRKSTYEDLEDFLFKNKGFY